MKLHLYVTILFMVTLVIYYRRTQYLHEQEKSEEEVQSFDVSLKSDRESIRIGYLPRGIVESYTDMELKPLWFTESTAVEKSTSVNQNLIAIYAGIEQKMSVNKVVRKFLSEKFTAILFHYDGNVNRWHDLAWSNNVIHISAFNRTKWWFAKRFLHPDVVSTYEYVFVWDGDLGVENFHPMRYVQTIRLERLGISHPTMQPDSEIPTITSIGRKKDADRWLQGMTPVFSRYAWECTWNLIKNDVRDGHDTELKFEYCAEGNEVREIDSEFIVYQNMHRSGESSTAKIINYENIGSPVRSYKHLPSKTVKPMRRKGRKGLERVQEQRGHVTGKEKASGFDSPNAKRRNRRNPTSSF